MEVQNIEAFLSVSWPNIFYLSGFTGSSGFICVTEKAAHLYTDFRYLQQAAAEAPGFEIVKVSSKEDFSLLAAFISKSGIKNIVIEDEIFTVRNYNRLQDAVQGKGVELVLRTGFLEDVRALKDEAEIEKITAAAHIADQAFLQILPLLKAGMRETEVALELEYRLRKGGSLRNPFEIIVASGPRSALPHGLASGRVINEGELIVMDFGAVFEGYCSDITRTFLLGAPDDKQKTVYDMVLEAQRLALESIEIGQSTVYLDGVARKHFDKLGYASYFGHGLGHGVGLEVHEFPTLSPLKDTPLSAGMVFTIEPGLYIEGWGGVRIEDLVVLREDGPQILTASPKELDYML